MDLSINRAKTRIWIVDSLQLSEHYIQFNHDDEKSVYTISIFEID